MADTTKPPPVRVTQRSWLSIVKQADQIGDDDPGAPLKERDPAYEWSNGKVHREKVNPYS